MFTLYNQKINNLVAVTLLFISFCRLNAQDLINTEIINNEQYINPLDTPSNYPLTFRNINFKIVHKNSEVSTARLSFGLGTATILGKNKFSYLISINGIFELGSVFYLEPGLDIYPEPEYRADTFTNLDLILLVGFNILRSKMTLFAGAGGFVYLPSGVGAPFGILASIRAEYNLNKKNSIGVEIKHPNYFGSVSKDNSILLFSISHTFKL